MRLVVSFLEAYRRAVASVIALAVASALLGVAVIAFVNRRLIVSDGALAEALLQFLGLLVLMFALASASQLALTALGHRFVYQLRRTLVKRLLDTEPEQVERLGAARLFASLSSDVRNLTLAFVHLPELIYGAALTVAALAYLGWLSAPLLAATVAWLAVTLAAGWLLVGRLNHHLRALREAEDRLYADYRSVIDGFKELALNRARARHVYEGDFDDSARAYRDHVTLADRYHGLASNWANVMVLGSVGLGFYLARGLGLASDEVAATYALTILFLRTPLVSAVAAIPSLMGGRVALAKLESLALAEHAPGFAAPPALPGQPPWRRLALRGVSYRYPAAGGEGGFAVGPLDLEIARGETVFLIGGNGSGKSSLARLLAGLYRPAAGCIEIDGRALAADEWPRLRAGVAAVFSDFHLFAQLLGPDGETAGEARVAHWTARLGLQGKLRTGGGRVLDLGLSQGQRKRVALLLALLEDRDILLLDEWAADQDPMYRRIFYEELLPELKRAGKTLFVITHDERYFHHADRLLAMEAGHLRELAGADRDCAAREAATALRPQTDVDSAA